MESAIKALVLPKCSTMSDHFLARGLPNLSELGIPVLNPKSVNAFAAALRDRQSRHLRHTRIGSGMPGRHANYGGEHAGHLRGCKRVGKVDDREGLKSVYFRFSYGEEEMMETLLKHSESLEELQFDLVYGKRGNKMIRSHNVQRLLSACSELIRFSITKRSMERAWGIMDVIRTPWACTRLRFLHLVLNPVVVLDSPIQGDAEEFFWRESIGLIYARIGALTELEELELEFSNVSEFYSGFDEEEEGEAREEERVRLEEMKASPVYLPLALSLDSGLRELKELKRLRRLILSSVLWEGVGQSECELMAREWPALAEIELMCGTRSHWHLLKKERH